MGCIASLMGGAKVPDAKWSPDTVSVIECGNHKFQLSGNITKLVLVDGTWSNKSKIFFLSEPGTTCSIDGTPEDFRITGLRGEIKCEGKVKRLAGSYYLEGTATYGAHEGTYKIGLETPSFDGI